MSAHARNQDTCGTSPPWRRPTMDAPTTFLYNCRMFNTIGCEAHLINHMFFLKNLSTTTMNCDCFFAKQMELFM